MKTRNNPAFVISFFILLSGGVFLCSCEKETPAPTPPASTADITAPVITISVNSPFSQYLPNMAGSGLFSNPSATASDNVDGDLSDSIVVTGTVNPNLAGSYSLTYTVSDAAGNTASQVLTVIIENSAAYLDGQYVNATDTCQTTPTSIFNSTVTSSNTTNSDIIINNFGAFGLAVNVSGVVSGQNIIIPSAQALSGGASIVTASGVVISSTTPVKFKINFVWTDGINVETCRSWYTHF